MINPLLLTKASTKETAPLLIFCSAIYLINPLLGILSLIGVIVKYKGSNEQLYYGLYAFLALYLGLINSTKIPVSDLLNHKDFFYLAGSMRFKEYIIMVNKEIVFFGSTYLLYYILGGSFKLYVITFTFIGYFIAFISLHKYWIYDDKRPSMVLFPVLLLFLYPNTFFYSAHLVRQTIAGFLFIYFLSEKATNNKNKWLYLILAIFIHTSVIFMFILCLIPNLNKKLNLNNIGKTLIIITIIAFLVVFTLPFLGNVTSGIGWLNYGFSKINDADYLHNYNFDVMADTNITYFRFIYSILLFIILCDYFLGDIKKQNYLIYNVFIIFIIFQEFLLLIGYYFLQMRLMVYMYMFIPFIIPSIFKQNSFVNLARYRNIFQFIIIMYAMSMYARVFNSSDEFAPLSNLLFNPVPFFFNN